MWCDAVEVQNTDDQVITWDQFCDFYADVSMKFFDEKDFINMVETSWAIKESEHIGVNKYDFAHFVAAFRHSLLKSGN